MTETDFWSQIRDGMTGMWVADRIENECGGAGIPDVSFGVAGRNGWMELKYLQAFPRREGTLVRIDHYTIAQKKWLRRRGRVAGDCWLFVRVADEWFLFDWLRAQEVTEWTSGEWREKANGHWQGRMQWKELYALLRDGTFLVGREAPPSSDQ